MICNVSTTILHFTEAHTWLFNCTRQYCLCTHVSCCDFASVLVGYGSCEMEWSFCEGDPPKHIRLHVHLHVHVHMVMTTMLHENC